MTLSFSRHLASAEDMPARVDAAIRYGSGNWQGVVTEYIAGREFVLIASDGLAGGRRAAPAEALPDRTLLHHEEAANAWPQWAARHGVAQARVAAGPRFAQYSAIIQAARSGLGIGLVPRILVEDELAGGDLYSPAARR